MKLPIYSILICAFCFIPGVASAQRAQTVVKTPAVSEIRQVFGTVEDRTYVNKFFGFTLEVPKEMTISDRLDQEMYADAGVDVMKSQTQLDTSELDAAVKTTINMLLVTKLPVGSPENSGIEIASTKQVTGVTAKMALTASESVMTSTGSFKVVNRFQPRKIGSYTYEISDMESTAFGIPLDHRMFVTMLKGYSVIITITKQKDGSYDEFEQLIGNIKRAKK